MLKERDAAKAAEEQARQETTDAQQQAEVDAETRADLLTMVSGLLPDGFERRGKSNKEILVAAAGDEVKDAANQSEDYLRAKLEDIIERRANVAGVTTYRPPAQANTSPLIRPLSISQMRAAGKGV